MNICSGHSKMPTIYNVSFCKVTDFYQYCGHFACSPIASSSVFQFLFSCSERKMLKPKTDYKCTKVWVKVCVENPKDSGEVIVIENGSVTGFVKLWIFVLVERWIQREPTSSLLACE